MDKHHAPASRTTNPSRRWLCATLSATLLALCLFAAPTIYIDPLFHYHAPLAQYQYPITNERYQNDGIVRHFTYDGIITGTSMTENFKTSEADALFGAKFVKVPFAGGYNKEIDANLRRAFRSGNQIRYIIRALDPNFMIWDKDTYDTSFNYPSYLYNDNPFDDIQYILNKDIFFDYTLEVCQYTRSGNSTTTFDSYAFWGDRFTYSAQRVMKSFTYTANVPQSIHLSDADRSLLQGNLQQNVIALAQEHPETTFYLFFSPFSIAAWGNQYNSGALYKYIETERASIEMLLNVPNIQLYSFNNNFDLICDLDNYKDFQHYGDWINSWILQQIAAGNYRLTQENYQDYLASIQNFYTTYDYPALNDLK